MEFALLLTPLVVMLFGTTELGRAIYTYNTLDKTVRDAARHLSQHGPGDVAVQTEARCLAVYGNESCSGPALAPGLTTAAVQICDALSCPGTHAAQPTGLGSVNLVTVGIQGYAYNSLVEFVVPDMTFNNIAATLRAQL
ncbi:MAG TPA: TadE/TadG family type IV pilus assembly protein [Burkholderiaceae bacterium]|nr:TadE/TadG family type IV pilus assembly protein [Burkholderiaceae bacterium]